MYRDKEKIALNLNCPGEDLRYLAVVKKHASFSELIQL